MICEQNLINKIDKMTILEPSFRSVHAPISFLINCKPKNDSNKVANKILPSPPKLIWNTDKHNTFQILLKENSFQQNLNKMNDILLNPSCTQRETENVAKQLTDSIFKVAKKCFRITSKSKKKGPKIRKNPWYNKECASLKSRFRNISRLIVKSPNDPYIRGKYFVIKKQYTKILKENKAKYEANNLSKL